MEDVMEDISKRKPAFGRSGLGIVAGSIVVGTLFSAIWLSFSSTDNHNPVTADPRHQQEAANGPTDHIGEHTSADSSLGRLNQETVAQITPDDDVDIVLGGSWRNADCTYVTVQVVRPSTGELVDAVECQRSSPKPTHEYETWSDEALEALAYSDPIACLVLGRRVAQSLPMKSWNLMVRSSALLGGDSRPIKWLATNSFNQVKENGEIATGAIQRRYVLDRLAERLEGSSDPSFDFREYYLRNSLDDTHFERLDRRVDTLLYDMKVIEEETTGKSTIQGAG
jgi:hypothetical protein